MIIALCSNLTMQIFLVGLFGALGVVSRYGIDRALAQWNSQFPSSTLLINICGSFLAGVCLIAGQKTFVSAEIQMALIVGFCGGFKTMSAFALQTSGLFESSRLTTASAYLIATPLLSVVAAVLGVTFGRRLF